VPLRAPSAHLPRHSIVLHRNACSTPIARRSPPIAAPYLPRCTWDDQLYPVNSTTPRSHAVHRRAAQRGRCCKAPACCGSRRSVCTHTWDGMPFAVYSRAACRTARHRGQICDKMQHIRDVACHVTRRCPRLLPHFWTRVRAVRSSANSAANSTSCADSWCAVDAHSPCEHPGPGSSLLHLH
jgi:hypothetical protein